jgi:hypothetical protein
MATVEMICHCGKHYDAREADLKRGWGYSCDKSCAAKRRDFSLPRAKRADGLKTKQKRKKPSGHRPNDQRSNGSNDIDDNWDADDSTYWTGKDYD